MTKPATNKKTLLERVRDHIAEGLPQIVNAEERERRVDAEIDSCSPLDFLKLLSDVGEADE